MAIDELLDEHEQGERVRSWLKNNGAGLLGGICVGLALILGWQWWGNHHTAEQAMAHGRYEAVVKNIAANDLDKAAKDVAALSDGKSGIYGELAALRLAKAQVEADKFDDAIKTLRAVPADDQFHMIVQQRLARLLIQSGKPGEVQGLLGQANDSTSLEIRGDAAVAQNQQNQARELYGKALAGLDKDSPVRRMLETKLMAVGGNVPDPA